MSDGRSLACREEEESGAVRRRKQRLRQKAAAAAVAVAVEAGADTATVASDDREQPENPNGQASNGSEQHKNNSSNGFATGDHAKAAVADGSKTAEERKTGETGKEAPTSDGGKRKRRGQIRAASTAQQAPKVGCHFYDETVTRDSALNVSLRSRLIAFYGLVAATSLTLKRCFDTLRFSLWSFRLY